MDLACQAEASAGKPQTRLLDTIDVTTGSIDSMASRYYLTSGTHWCTRHKLIRCRKPRESPALEFLGHASVYGLSSYIQKKLGPTIPGSNRNIETYLLSCAVWNLKPLKTRGELFSIQCAELMLNILKRGADPNAPFSAGETNSAHATNAWREFLTEMWITRLEGQWCRHTYLHTKLWTELANAFLASNSDLDEVICVPFESNKFSGGRLVRIVTRHAGSAVLTRTLWSRCHRFLCSEIVQQRMRTSTLSRKVA